MIKHHQVVREVFARRTTVVCATDKPVLKESISDYLGRLDTHAPCLAVEHTEPVRVDALNRACFQLSDAIAVMDSCAS